MSGKIKVIISIVITAALVSGIWAFVLYNKTKTITEKFEGEISQLTATLDALGPNVDCYTVTEEYCTHYDNNTAGQIITENTLQTISVPESLVGDSYVRNPQQLIGKYFKINVKPGTPITQDLVMAEKYDDTLRDVDIVVDKWVVGLRVGDYIDLNFTLPFGQDSVVLSHKRVQGIGSRTLKLYLTEEEWHVYNSVLVDHYLNSSNGSTLYVKKYVEPGIQKIATTYYAPSDAVRTMMLADPNIVSKAEINIKAAFRPAIDASLNQFIDENTTIKTQSAAISGGRSSYSGDVTSDYNQAAQSQSQNTEDTYEEQEVNIQLDMGTEDDEEMVAETGAVVYETTAAPETTVASDEETVPETTPETVSAGESLPAETEPDIVG